MNKIPYLKSIVALSTGLILLLISINFFAGGGGYIAVGIFGILVSLMAFFFAIINFIPELGKNKALKIFNESMLLACFLLYFFVMVLVDLIVANSGFGPSDWIVAIAVLATTLAGFILGALSAFMDNKGLRTTRDILYGLFIALYVVGITVGLFGGGTIGSIAISDLVFLGAFTFFTVSSLRNDKKEKVGPITPESEEAAEPSSVLTDKLDIN